MAKMKLKIMREKLALDSIQDGVLILDDSSRVILANKTMYKILEVKELKEVQEKLDRMSSEGVTLEDYLETYKIFINRRLSYRNE